MRVSANKLRKAGKKALPPKFEEPKEERTPLQVYTDEFGPLTNYPSTKSIGYSARHFLEAGCYRLAKPIFGKRWDDLETHERLTILYMELQALGERQIRNL